MKEEWLKELKHLLRAHYDRAELYEILNDYENFFQEGELRGKSVQELCADLGTPKEVAENLMLELPVGKRGQFSRGRQLGVWLTIILTGVAAWGAITALEQNFYRFLGSKRIVWCFMGYAAVFPAISWLVLRRGNTVDCSKSCWAQRMRKVVFGLQIAWYLLFLLFSYIILPYVVTNWTDSYAGVRLTAVFHAMAGFCGALTIIAALGIRNGNYALIREVAIGFGQLAGLYWFMFSVANYSESGRTENIIDEFLAWMQGRNQLCAWALFAIGIVWAVLFSCRLRMSGVEEQVQEGGKSIWMHK